MYVVQSIVGYYDDKSIQSAIVATGKLMEYLEHRRRNPPRTCSGGNGKLFVVENFGWNNPRTKVQTATPLPDDPESLFARNGASAAIAVLENEHSVCDDNLLMEITRLEDNAFDEAVSRMRAGFHDKGWCSAELELIQPAQ